MSQEPKCLECDGPLHKCRFIDTWTADGSPEEVYEDWYCSACGLRWGPLEEEPEEEAGA